jgi:hypothetical protein
MRTILFFSVAALALGLSGPPGFAQTGNQNGTDPSGSAAPDRTTSGSNYTGHGRMGSKSLGSSEDGGKGGPSDNAGSGGGPASKAGQNRRP